MSAGPTDRERISALEEQCRTMAREIDMLRDAKHRHGGLIQSLNNWEFDKRVPKLEAFQARLVGMAIGFGSAAGVVAALIVKLLER